MLEAVHTAQYIAAGEYPDSKGRDKQGAGTHSDRGGKRVAIEHGSHTAVCSREIRTPHGASEWNIG